MSRPREPLPVKLFLSAIYRDPAALATALEKISAAYGPSDYSTRELPFKTAGYYVREMGVPLFRRFFTFRRLLDPGRLTEVKFFTNELEAAGGGPRVINLDPGLLTMGNLVLASGKNVGHRTYLGQGIYAELTLVYQCGSFTATPWTYPDYSDPDFIVFLNRMREAYKIDLREIREEDFLGRLEISQLEKEAADEED
jgi:hypothetical protein